MNASELIQLRSDTYIKLAKASSSEEKKYYEKILHVIDSLNHLLRDIREISHIGNSV